MPTTTREERQGRILEAQSLISSGLTSKVATRKLMEKFGISEQTAQLDVKKAFAYWNRRRRWNDNGLRSEIALSRAERAMAVADAAGDTKTYLAAAQHEAKLLGLYAPEKHELLVAHFTVAMQRVVEAIAEEVEDVALRARLIQRIRLAFEEAPKGRTVDSLPAEVATDASVVVREPPPGETNGAAHRD